MLNVKSNVEIMKKVSTPRNPTRMIIDEGFAIQSINAREFIEGTIQKETMKVWPRMIESIARLRIPCRYVMSFDELGFKDKIVLAFV